MANQNRKHSRRPRPLNREDATYSLALTFYDEQLPHGIDALKTTIKAVSKEDYQIVLAIHGADGNRGKKHYHLALRCVHKKSPHVSTLLNMLGIKFRKGIDDALWENRGAETVGDFAAYIEYILHWTPKAKADGKTPYAIDDLTSNIGKDEIKAILDGQKMRWTKSGQIEPLIIESENAGYALGDFDGWIAGHGLQGLTAAKRNELTKAYQRGAARRADEGAEVDRISLVILVDKRSPNLGEIIQSVADAARKAFNGRSVLAFDADDPAGLMPSSDSVIHECGEWWNWSAKVKEKIRAYSSGRVCRMPGRGGCRVWAGRHYVMVTADDIYEAFSHRVRVSSSPFEARFSGPFFITHLRTDGTLCCDYRRKSGDGERDGKDADEYIRFRDAFNAQMIRYSRKNDADGDLEYLNS